MDSTVCDQETAKLTMLCGDISLENRETPSKSLVMGYEDISVKTARPEQTNIQIYFQKQIIVELPC